MDKSEMETKVTAEVPPEAEEYTGTMQIMATQCCGLHSVSGFQYHARGKSCSVETVKKRRFVADDKYIVPVTLKGFIRAIQKGYSLQRETNEQVARENAQAHERWLKAGAIGQSNLPHPYYTHQPTCRPGLLLFTWNNKVMYEPGAQSLAEQIKAAGLGECTISTYARNPNSGNHVASMVWALNVAAYDQYVRENDL